MFGRRSVAVVHTADVAAVGVELADPAAVTVAVIGIGSGGCRDRTADDGGADAPTQATRFGGSGGGGNAAGDGQCGDSESGNLGLDRHDLTPSGSGRAVVVRMYRLDGSWPKSVRHACVKFW